MILSYLECRTEDLLPVTNGFLFGGRRKRGIDGIARIEGGVHNRIRLCLGIEGADIIFRVNWIDDFHGLGEDADARCLIVVCEDDQRAEVSLYNVGEKVLERLGIVGEIKAFIREVRQYQLDHEGLESETVLFALHARRPEFDQAYDLREIITNAFTLANELQMARDAGCKQGPVILADELPIPVRIATVENGHHIDIETGPFE
jgi:hypothetical protein